MEHDEAEEIRKLRKEAADLRISLGDEGVKNDELYQSYNKVKRESESINLEYYQIKNELQDG